MSIKNIEDFVGKQMVFVTLEQHLMYPECFVFP
ncbi:MAG: hypothetical protein JSV84_03660 [Gemmatimonadota bacterium]|nr:MAG: hypothetical protein JSV84_03660 [Gemmatimonadota bacterium]